MTSPEGSEPARKEADEIPDHTSVGSVTTSPSLSSTSGVDRLSLTSLYLKLHFGEEQLGTATGFVVKYADHPYLITNWHVFSGRRTDDGQPIHKKCGIPNVVRIAHHTGELGNWVFRREPLEDANGKRLWFEHPRGSEVDVAALRLTKAPAGARFYALDMDRLAKPDFATPPGTAVSVIGFPLGLRPNLFFGVWKTGHIASDVDLREDSFLIDATTKEGMSGSPVIARQWRDYTAYVPSDTPGGVRAIAQITRALETKFLGIYSGRIRDDIEIGTVWKPKVIREVLRIASGREPGAE